MSCGPRSRTRSNSEKTGPPILRDERDFDGRVARALFDLRPSSLALTITRRLRSVIKEHAPPKISHDIRVLTNPLGRAWYIFQGGLNGNHSRSFGLATAGAALLPVLPAAAKEAPAGT